MEIISKTITMVTSSWQIYSFVAIDPGLQRFRANKSKFLGFPKKLCPDCVATVEELQNSIVPLPVNPQGGLLLVCDGGGGQTQ